MVRVERALIVSTGADDYGVLARTIKGLRTSVLAPPPPGSRSPGVPDAVGRLRRHRASASGYTAAIRMLRERTGCVVPSRAASIACRQSGRTVVNKSARGRGGIGWPV